MSGRTSGFPGNGCDSLPAGGAVRAVELAVSPVTAVIKAALLMNATLGKFQMEVSTPMPYSLTRAEPFEVSSLKGVGNY